ncbi:MAG: preprotein translocase subunit SecA [Oligoflexales bacterium]|nr:preprotein translocase subunit SecA [Oligoflexales bacterium]
MSFLTKLFGTKNDKIIQSLRPLLAKTNDLEERFKRLNDDELKSQSLDFRQQISNGRTLIDLLPEAYAVCREAARRVLNQRHFDVQILGGIVLHQGKISEMKTGEGKTLTATLPVYLHALAAQGAHVVTVNDYLARRDAEWMGAVYNFLGMSVGTILHGLNDRQRQEAYACDITYGTNNEFGFDFLRDNMKTDAARLVQRGHSFAIVDEVDSILIDEARTPLIISGAADSNIEIYKIVNTAIPGLQKDGDYTVDEKSRTVSFTEDGISKMEKRLRINNLYEPQHIDWLHHSQQALKAHVLFKKDVDYVVRQGEVLIVDEFTGRLMPGRRYSDGLHGALEAKERVQVQQETQTLATITFQNYFRLYSVLSGMTGTADTEAVEFKKIYNLDVVVIPTHRKAVRIDDEDVIFRTATEKFQAIAEDISVAQEKGQPVLVGTVSVEKSELLSSLLKKRNVPHDVLNAKNHAREASIIADAGKKGRVTIATNMAGRGTDIVLGEGVNELGGLYVIGTERHESRRIDNQLRGRSGRQGDGGRSKFFLSLEDDLMRIFASDKLSSIMARLGMKEGEAIVSPMVTRAIEKAQRRVEEQNFSSRKNLLEYDDVMNQQRQVIYQKRHLALTGQGDLTFFESCIRAMTQNLIEKFSPESMNTESWSREAIEKELGQEFQVPVSLAGINWTETSIASVVDFAAEQLHKFYTEKSKHFEREAIKRLENIIFLQIIDHSWKEHLLSMDALKDSVSLRGYGQRDPLQEYKREGFLLFESLMGRIENETVLTLLRMPFPTFVAAEQQALALEASDEELHPEQLTLNRGESESAQTLSEKRGAQEEKLIYRGSPSTTSPAPDAPQPYRRDAEKVGRNDLCPCGSQKKYKKCHGIGAQV